jgi:hypothetical protein
MARNRKGNDDLRTDECKKGSSSECLNMKETGGGFDGEQYECEVCGECYYLDYEDMK